MKKKLKKNEKKKKKIQRSIDKLKNKISTKQKKLSKIDLKIASIEKKIAEKRANKNKEPITASLNNQFIQKLNAPDPKNQGFILIHQKGLKVLLLKQLRLIQQFHKGLGFVDI